VLSGNIEKKAIEKKNSGEKAKKNRQKEKKAN